MTPHARQRSLVVAGLRVSVADREIIHGVDLEIHPGEVHAVMGPNGSGKSTLAHAIMGRPGTTITGGSITLDGEDLTGVPAWRRAQAGLFLALQHPVEVPGVHLGAMINEALEAEGRLGPGPDVAGRLVEEANRIGLDRSLLDRAVNVDLSGGERKRNETVQLGVLRPRYAVLDEIDSGLDVDALRAVARRIEEATEDWGLGVLAVTHFRRLLQVLRADVVHVLVDGRITASGGQELADELERAGYGAFDGRTASA